MFEGIYGTDSFIDALHLLIHADDTTVLETSRQIVESKIRTLIIYCKNNHIQLEISKCEFIVINDNDLDHGLLIEYGRICHIVKLPISMIRPFPLVNNSYIILYPQLEIIWKVSKSLCKYCGGGGGGGGGNMDKSHFLL